MDEGGWRAAREDMLGARACGARGRGRADADACTAQWCPWVRAHAKAGGASEAVEAEPALWRGGHGVQQCRNQAALLCLHRVYLQVCHVEEAWGGEACVKFAQHAAVRALLHHAQPDGHKRMGKLVCE